MQNKAPPQRANTVVALSAPANMAQKKFAVNTAPAPTKGSTQNSSRGEELR